MSYRLPQAPDLYDYTWAAELVRQLELEFEGFSRNFAADYTTSNVTTSRTLDANAADSAADLAALKTVVADLADVLGTLVDDLKPRTP